MIEVAYNLYNEQQLDSSCIKEFYNVEEAKDWFIDQRGHPYLSFGGATVKVGDEFISLWSA